MLTHLIAFGILAASSGGGPVEEGPFTEVAAVLVSKERTAVLEPVQPSDPRGASTPLGAALWTQQYDPADRTPYAIDFAPLLEAAEKIVSIDAIAMNATAAALGVGVDTDPAYAPTIDETAGKKCQLWFAINAASWDLAQFDAAGVMLPVTMRVTTDSTPPKRYERTAILTVRQL